MAEPVVEVRFTDARSLHWLRDENGVTERRKHPALDPGDERNWDRMKRGGDARLVPDQPL